MLTLALLVIVVQTPDTLRADTTRARRLGEVTVTVTRTAESLIRVPAAVAVVERSQVRGAQATLGLDESLNAIPGVYIANRYNYSLDQRLSIRGFGSRAPFGTRGVLVVLDGIPQTTPDGQSQFTNLELGTIGQIEVLRGSASSLYGNAAGGAIILTSDLPPRDRVDTRLRLEAGSFGLLKWQAQIAGGSGRLSGSASASRTTWYGFRQNSNADVRQLNTMLRYQADPNTTITARFNAGHAPLAQNPGALTFGEYALNRDSAAANNILRGSDKDSRQVQGGISVRRLDGRGNQTEATLFAYARDVDNYTATPTQPNAANAGTFVRVNRDVLGFRLSHGRRFGATLETPCLVAGLDAQSMADDRRNWRSVAGARTDPLLVDQREEVRQVGPFAQVLWAPDDRLSLRGGTRFDWFRFTAADRFLSDGEDNSGARDMSAWSASTGASYVVGPAFVPYLQFSTSFETPTTTELAIRPGNEGGFSSDLEPQRAVNLEAGAKGQAGTFDWSLAVYRVAIRNAIVQWQEIGGRSYFQNAGGITNWGAELGAAWTASSRVQLRGAYTWSRYRFTDYVVDRAGTVMDFDDKVLPGLPSHFARVGMTIRATPALDIDLEQTLSGSLWTDDANTPERKVDSWGAGVTNLRASWRVPLSRFGVAPFAGVTNLWDRRYVSSVVINGTFGRVLEPA
ncbi:MAG: TonB-dependent receptor, partial [Gemmatimonadota bacterium]|nr:TonB-dependent receptor [Gemmatimonadota bacterium]